MEKLWSLLSPVLAYEDQFDFTLFDGHAITADCKAVKVVRK